MRDDDLDVSLVVAAAAQGCDQCGGAFDAGRVTLRGSEVLSVICGFCVDDFKNPQRPTGRLH